MSGKGLRKRPTGDPFYRQAWPRASSSRGPSGGSTNGVEFVLAVVRKHSGGLFNACDFCDGVSPDGLRRSAKNLAIPLRVGQ
jgi:hypothetical protein